MRDAYAAILFDLYGTLVGGGGVAIDGARELLLSLPHNRWAVVTSCGRTFAESLLKDAALPRPFVLIAAEDVAAGKPAPDGYLKAAQALGVPPERCIVVEDSSPGLTAARLAGMDAIEVGSSRVLRELRCIVQENGTIAVRFEPPRA